MIKEYELDKDLTKEEALQAAIYYKGLALRQTDMLLHQEAYQTHLMNQNLELARQLDIITDQTFRSPLMNHNERVV